MSKDCKHYDSELDCCKLLSDWSEAMPVLQPCIDGPCEAHQLAEMEADLERCIVFDEYLAKAFGISNADYVSTAEKLYSIGWRKQSGWISVEERLPEKMETVLVCIKGYLKNPIMVVSEMLEEDGTRWSACCGFTVTHWMPLPEAPKMKGGAEE